MKTTDLKSKGSKNNPPKERRYPRCEFQTTVAINHRLGVGFETGLELSEGGMLLRADRSFRKGDICEISFVVSGRDFMTAMGEVVYSIQASGEMLVGIRFLPSTPNLKKLQSEISNYVSKAAAAAA